MCKQTLLCLTVSAFLVTSTGLSRVNKLSARPLEHAKLEVLSGSRFRRHQSESGRIRVERGRGIAFAPIQLSGAWAGGRRGCTRASGGARAARITDPRRISFENGKRLRAWL